MADKMLNCVCEAQVVKLAAARGANPKRRQRIPTCVSACVRGVVIACVAPESVCYHHSILSSAWMHRGVPRACVPIYIHCYWRITCVPRCTRGEQQSEQTDPGTAWRNSVHAK